MQVFDSYDPPRIAVAEANAPSERRALYARPTELGQAFNFDLLQADYYATAFRDAITFCLNQAAKSGSSSTWVLSNHDVVRHATRYALPAGLDLDEWLMGDGALPVADEARGLRRARAALVLMLALPGSSYFYQGEELGLHEVADLPPTALQDPIWLRTQNAKKGRDGCRVPLPWHHEGNSFGFGVGTRLAAAAGRLLADRGGRAGAAAGHHAGALPGGAPGSPGAADRRGADVGRDRIARGAALHPPGRLALHQQLRCDPGGPARRRRAGRAVCRTRRGCCRGRPRSG